METAGEGASVPTVGQALTKIVEDVLTRTGITDTYSDSPMVVNELEPAQYDVL
jgi:hypothetical protein